MKEEDRDSQMSTKSQMRRWKSLKFSEREGSGIKEIMVEMFLRIYKILQQMDTSWTVNLTRINSGIKQHLNTSIQCDIVIYNMKAKTKKLSLKQLQESILCSREKDWQLYFQ